MTSLSLSLFCLPPGQKVVRFGRAVQLPWVLALHVAPGTIVDDIFRLAAAVKCGISVSSLAFRCCFLVDGGLITFGDCGALFAALSNVCHLIGVLRVRGQRNGSLELYARTLAPGLRQFELGNTAYSGNFCLFTRQHDYVQLLQH